MKNQIETTVRRASAYSGLPVLALRLRPDGQGVAVHIPVSWAGTDAHSTVARSRFRRAMAHELGHLDKIQIVAGWPEGGAR